MYGMKKYSDFSERKRILSDIYDGAIKVSNSLRCACLPLHESFLVGGDFFENAATGIRHGKLPMQAVEESMSQYPVLKNADKLNILRFARGLDAKDCNGQLANLDIFINDTKKALAESESELNTKGRLYIKGSMLIAAAIVLLLI